MPSIRPATDVEGPHPLAAAYPTALDLVLDAEGVAVGRMLVEERDDAIRVVSLDVDEGPRRERLAAGALRHWLALAEAREVPITVDVPDDQQAVSVCADLGFKPVGSQSGRVLMRWSLG